MPRMVYDEDEWEVGDFAVIEVTSSAEIEAGTYVYEMVRQSDGERRWVIRSGFTESDFARAEHNRQRFGVPHAIADQVVAHVATGMVRLLPDCPCCEGVRNAHHITSDHT
jgi:hypothetical protein